MPSPFSIVIDNDALVNLTRVDKDHRIFNSLSLVFSKIHVPTEIFKEYEIGENHYPERNWLIRTLGYSTHPLWQKCTDYDSLVLDLYRTTPGIDKGEAAALAQFRKIGARFIVSDDRTFARSILELDKTIKVISSLHVLCWLDLHNYLSSWDGCLKSYHSQAKINSKRLRECYELAASSFGIPVDKKRLSQKTSLKGLGIT